MDVIELEKELGGLVAEIYGEQLPPDKAVAVKRVPQRLTANVQEQLLDLMVGIKYLKFEIEATQRENEYLRSLLREKG